MFTKRMLFLLALLVLMLQGCVTRIGDFTLASTKNFDLQGGVHAVSERTRVEGSDYTLMLGGLVFVDPDLEEAMDNALEESRGSVALTNVTIHEGFYGIPCFLPPYCAAILGIHVEGDPVFEVGGKPDAIITP